MVKVDFNPVSYKPNKTNVDYVNSHDKIQESVSFGSAPKQESEDIDLATISKGEKELPKENTPRNSAAKIWKFFAVANQMANSSLKGIFYGALTGVTFLTGSWLFKSLPNAFSKEGATIWQTIRHPLKNIGKPGKVIAASASGLVLAYHLVKGKLEANQKTAVIDHKLKVGHRDV